MGLFDSLKKSAAGTSEGAAELPAQPGARAAAWPSQIQNRSGESPSANPSPMAAAGFSGPRRLLFVGAEESWLCQFERDLAALQPQWNCARAQTAAEALEKWVADRFDTLILDDTFHGGLTLIQTLEKELAQKICVVRCRSLDRAAAALWKGTGATLLAGTMDSAGLIACIQRCARLLDWMADKAIKQLISQIRKLPAQPKLHAQVTQELQSPNGSMEVVGQLISQDPVMSAKIMQVVNSAFFGLTREISDPTESVMVLGAERIKALILLAGVFSQYASATCPGFAPEPVWSHSIQVGAFARSITLAETKDARTAEAAFTAGLLHDLGKLVLAGNVPEMYDTVQRLMASKKVTSREAEMEILGTSHAELGACLLATWGLPLPILDAIAFHHSPSRSNETGFSLIAAIHVANVLSLESQSGEPIRERVDMGYLLRSGLGDCRNRWRKFCGLEPSPEGEPADAPTQLGPR